jgi:hypothetical protein
MMPEFPLYRVLRVSELRMRYGLTASAAPEVVFDDKDVPVALRHLVPLARGWGVGDDVIREDLVRVASADARAELKAAVSEAEDELDAWLAGPEAFEPTQSDAYLAFSNLRMAADSVRL